MPTTTTESISRPKAAPINVQLPKFDGDPLQWRHFSNLFTTAIRTRAGGFSELDKRCLLVESLISPEAKMEVTNAPEEASLDELMELLSQRFGRPQTIVPILIKQVSKPDLFTSDYAGLQRLVQQFFKGADALKHHIGDSLSSYLMYSATMMFTPKLKAEWDQHVVHNSIKPSMDKLRKSISQPDYFKPQLQTHRCLSRRHLLRSLVPPILRLNLQSHQDPSLPSNAAYARNVTVSSVARPSSATTSTNATK